MKKSKDTQSSSKSKSKQKAVNQTVEQPKPQIAPDAKQAGRPPLPADYIKVSLTLRLSDILWIDRLCADIREQTGSILDRGSLLRGMIAAVQDSAIDLRQCKTEKQVKDTIKVNMGRYLGLE